MSKTIVYSASSDSTSVYSVTRVVSDEQWNAVLDILRPTRAGFVAALETNEDTESGVYHCDPISDQMFGDVFEILDGTELVTKFPVMVDFVIHFWVDGE